MHPTFKRIWVITLSVAKVIGHILLFLTPVILIAGLWAGLSYFIYEETRINETQKVELILEYFNLALGLITLLLSALILFYLIQFFIRNTHFAGKHPLSKILSLGIVSLLYYKSIKAILVYPIATLISFSAGGISQNFTKEVWKITPEKNYDYTQQNNNDDQYTEGYNHGYDDGYEDGYAVAADTNGITYIRPYDTDASTYSLLDNSITLLHHWAQQIVSIFSGFANQLLYGNDGDNIKHIIAGLLLLYIIGAISDTLLENNKPGTSPGYIIPFRKWLQENRVNLLFAGIFFLGSFLGISAIVAIPILQEGALTDNIEAEDFENQIEDMYNAFTDSTRLKEFHFEFDDKKFLLLKESLIAEWTKQISTDPDTNKLSKLIKKDIYSYYIQSIDTLIKNYHKQKSTLKNYKVNYVADLETLKDNLIRDYTSSESYPAIGNERVELFHSSLNYFSNYAESYKGYIRARIAAMSAVASENESLLAKSDAGSIITGIIKDKSVSISFYFPNINTSAFEFFGDQTQLRENKPRGVFSKMAEWLIKERSKEMVLITGMLGFGLLGAGISSVIRDRKNKHSLFQNNVTSTLVSGISASLIIFLSAKGGLAVFSGKEVELNQYALLFVCLVGSVFSESIWERAYKTVNNGNQHPPEEEQNSEGGKPPVVKTEPVIPTPQAPLEEKKPDDLGKAE